MHTATSRPAIARSVLELIGNTPVARLARMIGPEHAEVWGKLESCNPGGSVKDRICLAMIEAAERGGRLQPGDTVVEPTSGNTGIGLALVAAVKGYHLVLTMPDTMSEERRALLNAYGATLVLTEDSKGMHEAVRAAEQMLVEHPDYFMPQQFSNPANPDAHRRTTAQELLQQFPRIDAFVAGVGTGGTITGVGRFLRQQVPGAQVVLADPAGSGLAHWVHTGTPGIDGAYAIEGIGASRPSAIMDRGVIDAAETVSDDESFAMTRRLWAEEGLLVGGSGGTAVVAALRVAAHAAGPVVVLLPDSWDRYLSKPWVRP